MKRRGDTAFLSNSLWMHNNKQSIMRDENWLSCYLLRQQLQKTGEQLGISLPQMLLLALYRAVVDAVPQNTIKEMCLKFEMLSQVLLACHRRRVPFELVDFFFVDKLKSEIVNNRINSVTSRKDSGKMSEGMPVYEAIENQEDQ